MPRGRPRELGYSCARSGIIAPVVTLETDRLRGNWEAASSAYEEALLSADDDQQRLAAERAAATALSEHINASLLEPPLVE